MGGIKFGWLAVWVPSPDWLCLILELCDVCQALRWSHRACGRGCGSCPDFATNTLAFALQLRKITENLSQGNRRALGCSASNAIRLVDLAIAGDGLDWPAVPCRPWLSRQATGSTLGQPSCRTRVHPSSSYSFLFNLLETLSKPSIRKEHIVNPVKTKQSNQPTNQPARELRAEACVAQADTSWSD